MANFPIKGAGITQGESPSLYDNQIEDDTANKADTDGGYEFRRRRFARKPRRIIKTGFIGINHADYLALNAFYELHLKDVVFTWYDYIHDVPRQVRFDKFKPDYKGIGRTKLWDIAIEMSEV